jgi:hypothetical protein
VAHARQALHLAQEIERLCCRLRGTEVLGDSVCAAPRTAVSHAERALTQLATQLDVGAAREPPSCAARTLERAAFGGARLPGLAGEELLLLVVAWLLLLGCCCGQRCLAHELFGGGLLVVLLLLFIVARLSLPPVLARAPLVGETAREPRRALLPRAALLVRLSQRHEDALELAVEVAVDARGCVEGELEFREAGSGGVVVRAVIVVPSSLLLLSARRGRVSIIASARAIARGGLPVAHGGWGFD